MGKIFRAKVDYAKEFSPKARKKKEKRNLKRKNRGKKGCRNV